MIMININYLKSGNFHYFRYLKSRNQVFYIVKFLPLENFHFTNLFFMNCILILHARNQALTIHGSIFHELRP